MGRPGTNGAGGAGMMFAIVESSSGAASAAADEASDGVGGRGQDEHAARDGADRLEPVVEAGDHAEVAAATADRPEQVGV